MTDSEELPCPGCGAQVATAGGPVVASKDFSTGQVSSQSRETRDCPSCGRTLRRDLIPGAPWTLVDDASIAASGSEPTLALAPGQTWRKSQNEVIRIDSVDGNTVTGTLTTTNIPTHSVWAGSPADFEAFSLVED